MAKEVTVIIAGGGKFAEAAARGAPEVQKAIIEGMNWGLERMFAAAYSTAPEYKVPPLPPRARGPISRPKVLRSQVYATKAQVGTGKYSIPVAGKTVTERATIVAGRIGVRGSYPGGTVPWADWVESGTGIYHVKWRIIIDSVGNAAARAQDAHRSPWQIPKPGSWQQRTLRPANKIPTSFAEYAQTGAVYPRALIITPDRGRAGRPSPGGPGYRFFRPSAPFRVERGRKGKGVRFRQTGGVRTLVIPGQRPSGFLHKAIARNQGAMRNHMRKLVAEALGESYADQRFSMNLLIRDQ